MAFFPADHAVPETLRTPTFVLRLLRVAEAGRDYAAYMSSPDVIRVHSGGHWPVAGFTLADEERELATMKRGIVPSRTSPFCCSRPMQRPGWAVCTCCRFCPCCTAARRRRPCWRRYATPRPSSPFGCGRIANRPRSRPRLLWRYIAGFSVTGLLQTTCFGSILRSMHRLRRSTTAASGFGLR